jgi:thioredoxin reductase (NADPH)
MAPKPVLLTVDDDAGVARAIERDLKRRYGGEYRVLSASSGQEGLDLLERLKLRGDPVALMLVDQRMPRMNGVEFLEEGIGLFPEAKKALLTAYADTEAAIRAINNVRIDYYLQKPWEPPDEQLYPVLDDLLEDWKAGYREPMLRLVGHRWSRRSHEAKDFLARNGVPYQWLDVEHDEEATRLLDAAHADPAHLPLIVLEDGERLVEPSNRELAGKVGLATEARLPFYDLIIVGAGPAGLASAVYGASEGLRTALVDREAPGGQAGQSSRIENYLGFPDGLSGADLARRASHQATRFNAELVRAQEVTGIEARGSLRVVRLEDGTELSCHAVIVATGVAYRRLEAPGIERLTGRGVYYGAARTEALGCENQDIFVVGGANSAGQAAVYFSDHARTVNLLCRGDDLGKGMSRYLVEQIEHRPNIRVRLESAIVGAHGEEGLEAVTVADRAGTEERLRAGGLFIFIGAAPQTDWLGDAVMRDSRGFILSGPDLLTDGRPPKGWDLERDPFFLETSLPGVFVAGDVRHESVKRVASAVGDGAMAVQFVHRHMGSP